MKYVLTSKHFPEEKSEHWIKPNLLFHFVDILGAKAYYRGNFSTP